LAFFFFCFQSFITGPLWHLYHRELRKVILLTIGNHCRGKSMDSPKTHASNARNACKAETVANPAIHILYPPEGSLLCWCRVTVCKLPLAPFFGFTGSHPPQPWAVMLFAGGAHPKQPDLIHVTTFRVGALLGRAKRLSKAPRHAASQAHRNLVRLLVLIKEHFILPAVWLCSQATGRTLQSHKLRKLLTQ